MLYWVRHNVEMNEFRILQFIRNKWKKLNTIGWIQNQNTCARGKVPQTSNSLSKALNFLDRHQRTKGTNDGKTFLFTKLLVDQYVVIGLSFS